LKILNLIGTKINFYQSIIARKKNHQTKAKINRPLMAIVMLLHLFIPLSCAHAQGLSASNYLPKGIQFDANIPTPESIIGANVGEWHIRHDQLVQYMYALAEASPRVSIQETGRTHENRPLLLLTITSDKYRGQLDEIKARRIQQVMTGEIEGTDSPLILYMGYSVHGNEASGSNAAMLIAYYLAAALSDDVTELLDNSIILLDPSLNPDGLSRFAQWANMHKSVNLVADSANREHKEGWPSGRTNHYWFDLNRDWLMLVHPESRARIQQFQNWRPHILTDFHEMGSDSTYFFQPGVHSRKHPLTPEGNVRITEALAKFHAQAFDRTKTLYFSQEGFDDFFYGKGSSYPDAQGSVGILFEQASSRGHLQQTQNGLLSFPASIQNHITTTLSTFAGALANKPAILDYQRSFFKQTQTLIKEDDTAAYLVAENKDLTRLQQFTQILEQHKIQFSYLQKDRKIDEQDYIAGHTVVVPTDQPQYRLLTSLFSTQKDFANNTFYDVSNWNLPFALNLSYAPISKRELGQLRVTDEAPTSQVLPALKADTYAYSFEWHHYKAPALLQSLLENKVQIRVAGAGFSAQINGQKKAFSPGTLVIPTALAQPDQLAVLLETLSHKYEVPVFSLTTGLAVSGSDLGSRKMLPVSLPKVLLVGGEGTSQYEVGEVWHYLDTRVGVPVTLVDQGRLDTLDLPQYSHMIFVSGSYKDVPLNTMQHIEKWVKNGGTLIGQKTALRLFSQQNWLSVSVSNSKDIDKYFPEDDLTYADKEALKVKKLIAGAVYQADIDNTHPLFYGYESNKLPMFKTSNMIVTSDNSPFTVPARYSDSPLLGGYSAPILATHISGTTAAIVEPMGDGVVIGFTDNMQFRGFWMGTNKLLSNAIYMSPLMH
jgi:hypothetical protein